MKKILRFFLFISLAFGLVDFSLADSSYTYTNDRGDTLSISDGEGFGLAPTAWWRWPESVYINSTNPSIVFQKNNGGRYVIFIIEWRGGSPAYVVWDTYNDVKYFLFNAGAFLQKDISSDKINIVPLWYPSKSFILDINDPFNLQVQDIDYPNWPDYINNGFIGFGHLELTLPWGTWNNFQISPTPINLTQQVEMPDPDDNEGDRNYKLTREEIGSGTELGYKIGHFQSGSGIILSAYVDNQTAKEIKLQFTLTNGSGQTLPSYTSTGFTTGTGEVTVPDLPAGDYTWRVKTIGTGLIDSVEVTHSLDTSHPDFAIFYGFEPYPYGYKFENRSPVQSLLTGGIGTTGFPLYKRTMIPGYKWDVFYDAFDTSNLVSINTSNQLFLDNKKLLDAFEARGLDKEYPDILKNGTCYGLALSAAMKSSHSNYLQTNFSGVWNTIGSQDIWNIPNLGSSGSLGWDLDTPFLKSLLSLHLSQFSFIGQKAQNDALAYTPLEVLDIIKANPGKPYLIGIVGTGSDGKEVGHIVVAYKAEGNRIYIQDSVIPFPNVKIQNKDRFAYEQYITINSNISLEAPFWQTTQNWKGVKNILFIDTETISNNNQKSHVIGFNGNDLAYSVSGNADAYLVDSIGRISGYVGGNIFREIPGVIVAYGFGATLSGTTDNTFKQIYLPQKMDGLTLHIEGTTDEKYTLMIAGGDYYQKLEGVPINPGQIDTFETTGTGLTINFDDSKTGTYSLLVDNFHDYGTTNTGTVYIDSTDILPQSQQYSINWTKVVQNTPDALTYQIDTNNDGTYDTGITLPSVYRESTEKKIYTLLHPQTSNNSQNSGGGGWGGGSAKQRENTQQGVKNVGVSQPVYTTQTGTLTPKPQTSQTTLVKKGGKTLYSTQFYREDEKQMIQKNKQTKTDPKEKVPPKLRTKIEIKRK